MKNRTLALFRTGAWCWVITGAGHSALEFVRLTGQPAESDAAVTTAMRAHTVEFGGVTRSMYDFITGFSLAMGFAIALSGVLFLALARTAPHTIRDRSGLTWLALGATLAFLTLAALFMPSPPIVLFTVGSLSFGLSLLARRPQLRRATAENQAAAAG